MKGTACLLFSAAIWGFALVAQKEGMTYLGAFSFTSIRCLLGGISMLPLVWWRTKKSTAVLDKTKFEIEKEYWTGALQCGFFLTCLMLLQQLGLPYTTVGKAAFITALYIPLTPMFESITGKKISKFAWISVATTMVGVYLLCFTDDLSGINLGDICMLAAAVAASLHILTVGKWAQRVDSVKLSCYQFIVVGLICLPLTFAFDMFTIEDVKLSLAPILYAGLCSCGFGYTFQVIGQKYTSATKTGILLSTETIFSLVAGMIFYSEIMSVTEYIGCGVMFLGVLLSQKQD